MILPLKPPLKPAVQASKKLGQHFILDYNVLEKIVDYAGLITSENVLEIGPGPGGLSYCIAERAPQHFTLIEKDAHYAEMLQGTLVIARSDSNEAIQKNMTTVAGLPCRFAPRNDEQPVVIGADILKIDLKTILKPQTKVISNLPYNISTQVLIRLTELRSHIKDMILMFQKEVAQRIVAQPHTKDYGRLSVMSQIFWDAKIVYALPPSIFVPQPRVWSSVVRFEPKRVQINEALLSGMLQHFFSNRRKMLSTTLQVHYADTGLAAHMLRIGVNLQSRPENLTPEQFLSMARFLEDG